MMAGGRQFWLEVEQILLNRGYIYIYIKKEILHSSWPPEMLATDIWGTLVM